MRLDALVQRRLDSHGCQGMTQQFPLFTPHNLPCMFFLYFLQHPSSLPFPPGPLPTAKPATEKPPAEAGAPLTTLLSPPLHRHLSLPTACPSPHPKPAEAGAPLTSRARLLSGRALAYEGLSEWQLALSDYDSALQLAALGGESPDPYVINSRGNCYNSLHQWEAARADYLTASGEGLDYVMMGVWAS